MKCKRCGADMEPGQAIVSTTTTHIPDEATGPDMQTLQPAGPGRLVGCNKCPECGYSVAFRECAP